MAAAKNTSSKPKPSLDGAFDLHRQYAATHIESSARLSLGESVLFFDGGEAPGAQAVIIGGYQLREVESDDGRLGLRPGYTIRLTDPEPEDEMTEGFVIACRLTRADCKPSHIRFVGD